MMGKRVMIVGSNPSRKSSTKLAFSPTTKSGRTLEQWLAPYRKFIATSCVVNVYDKPTENNRPLTNSEIESGCVNLKHCIILFEPDIVVAVGKTSARALTLLGFEFYELPHPSGLNRQLNDPKYIEGKLKGLEALLQPTPSECASEN